MSARLPSFMKLLFEEIGSRCFKPTHARIQKFKKWVHQSKSAREKGSLELYPNQYDKAEELITFYTFAPFFLSSYQAKLVNRILNLAGIAGNADSVVNARLEKLIPPPSGYLAWIKGQVENPPVKYIREKALAHNGKNKPLEAPTHVDAFIETNRLLIIVEMKFISDISYCTTFNPSRNQLARLIDVGISNAIRKHKKLVVLLCSPSLFFVNKSRFYSYKITEYSDYEEIKKDIEWRKSEEIDKQVLAVGWIPLESLIEVLYQDFDHPDKEEALNFFKERNLA
jgi:hypothetical protein